MSRPLPREPESFPDLDGALAVEYRRRIAVHEASHATASLMTGTGRSRIVLTVIRRGDGSYGLGGEVFENVPAPPPRLALDYHADRAFVGMAGAVGEARFCRKRGYVFLPWAAGLAGDSMALDAHARRIAGGYDKAYLSVLARRVGAELDRSSVWGCVMSIATRLERVWPLEAARLGGAGTYRGEMSADVVASIAKAAGLPGRRR
jgi:hypothetical protein